MWHLGRRLQNRLAEVMNQQKIFRESASQYTCAKTDYCKDDKIAECDINTSSAYIRMNFLLVTGLINSLWPERFQWNFRRVLSKPITVVDGWDSSCEIAYRRISLDLTDNKSILVQVMACCRQATSHYLNQCWHSFLWPNGVTRP